MQISRCSPIAPAAALTALLMAGCGGSSPKTTTSSSKPADGVQAAYKFSACMREHGVSNFPDPIVHTSGNSQSIAIRVTPALTGSPAFKSAQQACQGILPAAPTSAQQAAQQHAKAVHLLSFAQCMRSHGIASFPDPNRQGNIPPATLAQAGVDIHLPKVIAAARACVPASGGVLTQAAITQATASGSGAAQSSGSGSQSNGP